jgi:methylglutaconyl-CoA hydratase
MKFNTILLNKKKGISTISLNRPNVHNAMNEKLIKELTNCFEVLSGDENTRLIILTGLGKSFCAGADLNWMKSMANFSIDENIQDSNLLSRLYESIYSCPKPVIGKINGSAFGGGIGLIAVCDISVSLPENIFAFSEVNLGIIPSVISTYIVKRIGISNMRRLFITGERFDANYAKKIGLIDFLVEKKELDKIVDKYSKIIFSSGPNAIIEVKELIFKYEELPIEKYKEYTVQKISDLRVSNEGQEGINAFLEKRKPIWSR